MTTPYNQPEKTLHARPQSGGARVWVISADDQLADRIGELLRPVTDRIGRFEPETIKEESFWTHKLPDPALVILDIDRDIAWGVWALQRLRRARVQAPVVVLTQDFSRDFGAKIISEGVRYYFSHDFCQEEFLEVAESLLKK